MIYGFNLAYGLELHLKRGGRKWAEKSFEMNHSMELCHLKWIFLSNLEITSKFLEEEKTEQQIDTTTLKTSSLCECCGYIKQLKYSLHFVIQNSPHSAPIASTLKIIILESFNVKFELGSLKATVLSEWMNNKKKRERKKSIHKK